MWLVLGVLALVLVAVTLLVAFVAITWEHDVVQRYAFAFSLFCSFLKVSLTPRSVLPAMLPSQPLLTWVQRSFAGAAGYLHTRVEAGAPLFCVALARESRCSALLRCCPQISPSSPPR